jgi:hypothetical protein
MTPTPNACTGYDSFWTAAPDPTPAPDRADAADAYAAFAVAADPD